MINKTLLENTLKTLEHIVYTYEDELSIQSFQIGVDTITALREAIKENNE